MKISQATLSAFTLVAMGGSLASPVPAQTVPPSRPATPAAPAPVTQKTPAQSQSQSQSFKPSSPPPAPQVKADASINAQKSTSSPAETKKTETPAAKPETVKHTSNEASKPAVKPADKPVTGTKPVDKPAPVVKPADKPLTATKPVDKPAPVVKPADKPATVPKAADKPLTATKPIEKPAPVVKPVDKPAPVVKPADKPVTSVKLQDPKVPGTPPAPQRDANQHLTQSAVTQHAPASLTSTRGSTAAQQHDTSKSLTTVNPVKPVTPLQRDVVKPAGTTGQTTSQLHPTSTQRDASLVSNPTAADAEKHREEERKKAAAAAATRAAADKKKTDETAKANADAKAVADKKRAEETAKANADATKLAADKKRTDENAKTAAAAKLAADKKRAEEIAKSSAEATKEAAEKKKTEALSRANDQKKTDEATKAAAKKKADDLAVARAKHDKDVADAQRKLAEAQAARQKAATDAERKKYDDESRKLEESIKQLNKQQQTTRQLTDKELALQRTQQKEIADVRNQIKQAEQQQANARAEAERTRYKTQVTDLSTRVRNLEQTYQQRWNGYATDGSYPQSYNTNNYGSGGSGYVPTSYDNSGGYGNSYGNSGGYYPSSYGSGGSYDTLSRSVNSGSGYGYSNGGSTPFSGTTGSGFLSNLPGFLSGIYGNGATGTSGGSGDYTTPDYTQQGQTVDNLDQSGTVTSTYDTGVRSLSAQTADDPSVSSTTNYFGDPVDERSLVDVNPQFDPASLAAQPGSTISLLATNMLNMEQEGLSLVRDMTKLATDSDGNGQLDRPEFQTLAQRFQKVVTQCQRERARAQALAGSTNVAPNQAKLLQTKQQEQMLVKTKAIQLQDANLAPASLRKILVDLDTSISRGMKRTQQLR